MKKETVLLGVIALLVVVGVIIGSKYYNDSVENANIPKTAPEKKKMNEALVRPDSPTLGPADAKVTIVEFYDPECESCAAFHDVSKKVVRDYDGKVRMVARIMPLHPNSMLAATFILMAAEDGKYWQAQEYVFRKQPEWGTRHGAPMDQQPDAFALFDKYAADFGLDVEKFKAAVKENKYAAKIARDQKDGQSLGVARTPTIFINGRQLASLSEPALTYLVEQELKN